MNRIVAYSLTMASSQRLFLILFFTRLALLFVMCIVDHLVEDYDTSAFLVPSSETSLALKCMTHWDGLHFLHISLHGYTHKLLVAFFPLFPLVGLGILPQIFTILYEFSSGGSSLLAGVVSTVGFGVVLNCAAFACAGVTLRHITCLMLEDGKLYDSEMNHAVKCTAPTNSDMPSSVSRRTVSSSDQSVSKVCNQAQDDDAFVSATVWSFIFSPSSVFTVSLYTESVFAALTFQVIFSLRRCSDYDWMYILLFSCLASFTRANGILMAPLALLFLLRRVFVHQKGGMNSFPSKRADHISTWFQIQRRSLLIVVAVTVGGGAPFLIVNYFSALSFAQWRETASQRSASSLMWSFYQEVQREYWKVSFLGSWEAANLPNFVLMAPTICALIYGSTLSLLHKKPVNRSLDGKLYLLTLLRLPEVTFLAMQVLFALLFMHVQVLQRFIFSSPALYWCSSLILTRGSDTIKRLWLWYWAVVIPISIVMFCNFFPWT